MPNPSSHNETRSLLPNKPCDSSRGARNRSTFSCLCVAFELATSGGVFAGSNVFSGVGIHGHDLYGDAGFPGDADSVFDGESGGVGGEGVECGDVGAAVADAEGGDDGGEPAAGGAEGSVAGQDRRGRGGRGRGLPASVDMARYGRRRARQDHRGREAGGAAAKRDSTRQRRRERDDGRVTWDLEFAIWNLEFGRRKAEGSSQGRQGDEIAVGGFVNHYADDVDLQTAVWKEVRTILRTAVAGRSATGTDEIPVGTDEIPVGTEKIPVGTERILGGRGLVPVGTEWIPGGTESLPGGPGRFQAERSPFRSEPSRFRVERGSFRSERMEPGTTARRSGPWRKLPAGDYPWGKPPRGELRPVARHDKLEARPT